MIYLFELVCKYDSIEAKNPIRSSTFSTFFTLSCLRLSMLGYISIFDKSFEHKTIYLSFIKAGQGFDNITKLLNVWKTLKHLTNSLLITFIITNPCQVLTEFMKQVFPRFFSPSLFFELPTFSSFVCWTKLIMINIATKKQPCTDCQ